MMRLLTLMLYYVRWQRTMAWTSGTGVAIMALSLVLPPAGDFFAIMFGGGLALGFPVIFAGVAYRQLIGHRRLLLVPELRVFAAGALLALTLVASSLVYVWMRSGEGWLPGAAMLDSVSVAAIAFGLISAHLLITQWLATRVLGIFALFLLPVVMLRIVFDEQVYPILLAAPWTLALIAVAGWTWLLVMSRQPVRPRPLAIPRWQLGMTDEVVTTAVTQPPGNIATAAGTLMRGFGDSFRTRLTGVLLWLLLMPLSFVLALWILGVTLGATDNGISIPTFFLLWSVIGGSMQATQFFREWPARLRSLWLRHPGDRLGAWKLLETTLWGDISLIIVVATTVAVPFGLLTDVDKNLLALYVLGSGVLTAFSSYFGFLTRIAGWHSVVHALSFVLILSVCIAAVISVRDGGPIPSLYVTLLMLAAIAAVFRAWSRRRLLSIDWCAVRPTKVVRAGLIR